MDMDMDTDDNEEYLHHRHDHDLLQFMTTTTTMPHNTDNHRYRRAFFLLLLYYNTNIFSFLFVYFFLSHYRLATMSDTYATATTAAAEHNALNSFGPGETKIVTFPPGKCGLILDRHKVVKIDPKGRTQKDGLMKLGDFIVKVEVEGETVGTNYEDILDLLKLSDRTRVVTIFLPRDNDGDDDDDARGGVSAFQSQRQLRNAREQARSAGINGVEAAAAAAVGRDGDDPAIVGKN